ncbi:MAG: tetratricopeptide repeat protein [Vicinamibacteria bacterium]
MLLALLLLVVAHAAPVEATYDLAGYLRIADAYADEDREAAVRDIRSWPAPALKMAVVDLRGQRKRIRADDSEAGSISARTVDAAVLMHAETGLLALRAGSTEEAERHLTTAMELRRWLVLVASESRGRSRSRKTPAAAPMDGLRPGRAGSPVGTWIPADALNLALAAGALDAGSAATAYWLVVAVGGLDPDVLLVAGAVDEGLVAAERMSGRTSQEEHQRERAARSLATAIRQYDAERELGGRPAVRRTEALLRLARVSLDSGWLPQARKGLVEVEKSGDERQRYLARLFLGRVAEREGKPDEAVGCYRRALEEWPAGQSAALALASLTERQSGAAAARPIVEEALARPLWKDGRGDPWRTYLFGLPGLAGELFDDLRREALERP